MNQVVYFLVNVGGFPDLAPQDGFVVGVGYENRPRSADDLVLETRQVRGVVAKRDGLGIKAGQGVVTSRGVSAKSRDFGVLIAETFHGLGYEFIAGKGGSEVNAETNPIAEDVLGIVAVQATDVPCRSSQQGIVREYHFLQAVQPLVEA